MFAEPPDLDRTLVRDALAREWGIAVASLEYAPVGFGTHHYDVVDKNGARWFVNVDDLDRKGWFATDPESAFDVLSRAFTAITALAGAGLEFVVAPIEMTQGGVLLRLNDRYSVCVVPYIDATQVGPEGDYENEDDRRDALTMLGRLHASADAIPDDLLARNDLSVPMRDEFFATLEELDRPWGGGPFSESTRELLTARRGPILDLFAEYDEIASRVRRTDWVVTHGEPHASNVMRRRGDGLVLIDWDTVMIAPRERDLWQVGPAEADGWQLYADAGGTADLDEAALELYRRWWTLAEIAGYTADLRSPHVDDGNTRAMWKWFNHFTP